MRLLDVDYRSKRGCTYCTKVRNVYIRKRGGLRLACPYNECPYKVLDKYDTYEDYMKSKDSKIAGLF